MAHRYAVTGALSYTGRYIAKRLFEQNKSHEIVNLSRRSAPIALAPLSLDETWRLPPTPPAWDNPELLRAALRGCDALFATYFVRFVDGSGDPHARAAANLANLFDAAAAEGVKVVFSSHTRTSLDSPFSHRLQRPHIGSGSWRPRGVVQERVAAAATRGTRRGGAGTSPAKHAPSSRCASRAQTTP